MQTEMMSDAIDDALDNDEAEEETDELTDQVGPTCIIYDFIVEMDLFTDDAKEMEKKSLLWSNTYYASLIRLILIVEV